MNVGELKQALEGVLPIPDDREVTIRFRGGMGSSTVAVKSVSPGFDWTNGQLVISPETDLVIDEWYRDLKKGAGAGASHLGAIVKEAQIIVDAVHDPTASTAAEMIDYDAIDRLKVALDRLARFQKRGF